MTIMQEVDTEALLKKFWETDEAPSDVPAAEAVTPPAEAAPATEAAVPVEPETPATTTEEPKQPEVVPQSPAPSTASPDPNDWLSKLPEDIRSQIDNVARQAQLWQQRHQELASKNRKLYNEVANLKKKVEETPKPQPSVDSSNPLENDEDWKQLVEVDPKLAKLLRAQQDALKKEIAAVKAEATAKAEEAVVPIREAEHERYVQEQQYLLTQMVPDWREHANSQMFQSWLMHASPGVQSLYGSLDARDSVRLLKLYDDDMRAFYGQQQQQQAPAVNTEQAKAAPHPVVAQRQERLAKSAPTPAQPAGTPKSAQKTPEQLFKELYDNPDAIFDMVRKT